MHTYARRRDASGVGEAPIAAAGEIRAFAVNALLLRRSKNAEPLTDNLISSNRAQACRRWLEREVSVKAPSIDDISALVLVYL